MTDASGRGYYETGAVERHGYRNSYWRGKLKSVLRTKPFLHAFTERAVLKLMYAALIRANGS